MISADKKEVAGTRILGLLAEAGPVPPVAQAAVSGPNVSSDELKALGRFRDCCEDSDADGHDVPKPMMQRLAKIGLVRALGFGRHETTDFGDFVLAAPPAAPVLADLPTCRDCAADHPCKQCQSEIDAPAPADLTDEQKAAPELLAAAKEFLSAYESDVSYERQVFCGLAVESIRMAITKAARSQA